MGKHGPNLTDAQLKETWDLATCVGQRGAARRLGMSQMAVQERLRTYAKRIGHEGLLPGYSQAFLDRLAVAEEVAEDAASEAYYRVDRRLSKLEGKLDRLLAMAANGEVRIVVTDNRRHADIRRH